MVTIATAVPTTALSTGTRARVLVLADGCRVVVYTDGSDLLLKGSLPGASWGSPVTILAGVTTLPATLAAVAVGDAIHVYRASGSTISCTRIPYIGIATFGSAVTATIAVASTSPSALRAVFDPAGVSTDSQHTGGTGIIHLLLDCGTTWQLWACDPHTAATNKPKVVLQTTVSVPFLSPAANADLVLRQGGSDARLYLLGSGSATDGWAGCEIAYTSTPAIAATENPLARPAGPFEYTYQQETSGAFAGQWLYGSLASGVDYAVRRDQAGKTLDSPGGTWGWTLPSAGGELFSGTWEVDLDLLWNITGITGQAHASLRVYHVAGLVKTLQGTITGSATAFPGGGTSWFVHLTATGTLPDFTTLPGDSVYVEVVLTPDTDLLVHDAAQVAWSGVGVDNVTVTSPAGIPTAASYTAAPIQKPALPAVASGASLVPDGANGVDILLNDAGTIRLCNRTPLGAFQPVRPLFTGATLGLLPQGSLAAPSTSTAKEALVYHAANHLSSAARSSGAWGLAARYDTASGSIEQAFAATDPSALAKAGTAIAYVSAGDLLYEDAGFAATASTPTAPLVSIVPRSGAFAESSTAGGIATTLTPTLRTIMQNALASVPLGAISITVHDDTASANVWVSGRVPVSDGPLPGDVYDVHYGSIGASATALTYGHDYTATVTTEEALGGNVSPGRAFPFSVYHPVSVAISAPDVFTTLSETVTFTPTQADGVPLVAYRYVLLDPAGSLVLDTGTVLAALTSGTPQDISIALAGRVTNGAGYRQGVIVTAAPSSGLPSFQGSVDAAVTAAITTSPVPVIDSFAWTGGGNPFVGGSAVLTYHEPAGSPAAVAIIVRLSTNGGPFQVLQTRPVPSGSDTVDIATLNNHDVALIGVSSVSADGVESGMAIAGPVTATFYYGFWVIQQSDPTIKLELGRVPKDSGDLDWTPTQNIDDAELFDRPAPLPAVGTLWYRTSNELVYLLPHGYEEAMTLQLELWNREATPVIVKDPDGLTHICRVLTARRTHLGTTKIRAIATSFKEVQV